MAQFNKFFDQLIELEREYQAHPSDAGNWFKGQLVGTNWGVTPTTYFAYFDKVPTAEKMKNLKKEDARMISKALYWDKIKGDDIISQSIAELLFDFAYNSGVGTAVQKIQKVLDTRVDGIMGPTTVAIINLLPAEKTFEALKDARKAFIQAIVRAKPSQKVFLNGWINRINSFKFKS